MPYNQIFPSILYWLELYFHLIYQMYDFQIAYDLIYLAYFHVFLRLLFSDFQIQKIYLQLG
nr:MAG TPA: hypothetical protein [Crassvirales sp.]